MRRVALGSGTTLKLPGLISLNFEMVGESLEFFVDGILVAESGGDLVAVNHALEDPRPHLLAW